MTAAASFEKNRHGFEGHPGNAGEQASRNGESGEYHPAGRWAAIKKKLRSGMVIGRWRTPGDLFATSIHSAHSAEKGARVFPHTLFQRIFGTP